MKIEVQPDKQKAGALLRMAKVTLERLRESNVLKYPSNTLLDYYEIVHKILEAIAFSDGIKIKGEGAHLELIEYVCNKYALGEMTRLFLQELRDYRNRTSYEGFVIKPEYIKRNNDRITQTVNTLIELSEKKL